MLNFIQQELCKNLDFIHPISNYDTLIIAYVRVCMHMYIYIHRCVNIHICTCMWMHIYIYPTFLHIFKLHFWDSNIYFLLVLKKIKYKCVRTNGWKQMIYSKNFSESHKNHTVKKLEGNTVLHKILQQENSSASWEKKFLNCNKW